MENQNQGRIDPRLAGNLQNLSGGFGTDSVSAPEPKITFTSPPTPAPPPPPPPKPAASPLPTPPLSTPKPEASPLPTPPSPMPKPATSPIPGSSVPTVPPTSGAANQNAVLQTTPGVQYAGFWVRWVANFIDGLIIGVPIFIISVVLTLIMVGFSTASLGKAQTEGNPLVNILIRLILAAIGWSYFVLMTKKYQATLGKKAVGIRVVSDKSNDLTWGQLILRETIGKIVSAIILYIGYIMAGFTKRKQALHDMIAGTVVVHNDPNHKIPWWAIALALFLPTIAIIGILASVVLVSLSSAQRKANDASLKSSIMAMIPEAILYNDSHGSYLGFQSKINLTPNAAACSGQSIVNISPDGKNIAIFGKLCSDGKKYFCADPQSTGTEVDDTYANSGASACKSDNAANNLNTTLPQATDAPASPDVDIPASNAVNIPSQTTDIPSSIVTSPADSDDITTSPNSFTDPTTGYVVNYPAEWVATTGKDGSLLLVTANGASNIIIATAPATPTMTAQMVMDKMKSGLASSKPVITDDKDFTYDLTMGITLVGKQAKFEYVKSGIKVKQWAIVVPGRKNYYTFIYTSPLDSYESNRSVAIDILGSWSLKEK